MTVNLNLKYESAFGLIVGNPSLRFEKSWGLLVRLLFAPLAREGVGLDMFRQGLGTKNTKSILLRRLRLKNNVVHKWRL